MAYSTNKKHKERIDRYLERMASINAHLGTDSSPREIKEASRKIAHLEEKIKDVDEEFYKQIVPDSERLYEEGE
tara:strand:- start:1104 stop:1325 length:222 start_codon:yes stop_codon:yes gene_type:complete